MEATRRPGMIVGGLWFLSPKEALEACRNGALLVDLRLDALIEMKGFMVPEWTRIPHHDLREQGLGLPKDRLLVLADSSGVYLRQAAETLSALGYDQIACLNGGMLHWDQAGLPVNTDPASLLNGQCPCALKPSKGRAR